MGTKLYVGNLSFNTTETDLQDLFAQAGPVQEVTLMQDKFTGKSRGLRLSPWLRRGRAKAPSRNSTEDVEGRPLTVNEARPREPRPPGGGGGAATAAVAVDTAVVAKVVVASEEATRNSLVPIAFVTTAKFARRGSAVVRTHNCARTPRGVETASTFDKIGQGWIRTSEGVSQQIYSLPRLATSVPTRLYHESFRR